MVIVTDISSAGAVPGGGRLPPGIDAGGWVNVESKELTLLFNLSTLSRLSLYKLYNAAAEAARLTVCHTPFGELVSVPIIFQL
jgi:hypothetical protein